MVVLGECGIDVILMMVLLGVWDMVELLFEWIVVVVSGFVSVLLSSVMLLVLLFYLGVNFNFGLNYWKY